MQLSRLPILLFVSAMLLSSFWTVSASSVDVLLTQKVSLKKVASLEAEKVRADLQLLLNVLENAYGGKNVLPGNQYQTLLNDVRQLSQTTRTWSSDELCDAISALTEKVNDFHLTVHIEDRTCNRVWPEAHVGPNVAQGSKNKTWALISKTYKNQTVDVLAIRKMTSSLSSDWDGFLGTVEKLVKKGRPFILDLRGNPGGDSRMGAKMASILLGISSDAELSAPRTTFRRRTPEAWAVMANSFWLQKQAFDDEGTTPPEYLKTQYDAMVDWYKKSLNGEIPNLQTVESGNTVGDLSQSFASSLYVLIDRDCGSSCELTLEALSLDPRLTTIGENTTGVVQYGNVGKVYLPNSRLVVNIPTQGSVYKDGRQVEKIGYTPKHSVPSGSDALDFALKKFFH